MFRQTTCSARLEVNVESRSPDSLLHGDAQAEEHAAAEREVEKGQEEASTRVIGEVGLLISPMECLAKRILSWRKAQGEDDRPASRVAGQRAGLESPSHAARLWLLSNDRAEAVLASGALRPVGKPLLDARGMKGVAASELANLDRKVLFKFAHADVACYFRGCPSVCCHGCIVALQEATTAAELRRAILC